MSSGVVDVVDVTHGADSSLSEREGKDLISGMLLSYA